MNCYGQVHFDKDSNYSIITNCSQSFQLIESIYGNKDFGICYELMPTERSIYLKVNDFLQITLNTDDLLIVPNKYQDHSDLYLFFGEDNRNKLKTKYSSLLLNELHLNSEIKIRKTSIHLLSTPHMNQCIDKSKSIILLIYPKISVINASSYTRFL